MIRRLAIYAAVVAAALAANFGAQIATDAAAHAVASTHAYTHISAASTHTACTPTVTYNFTAIGTPQGGATQWNRSCSDQQQVKLKCWSQLDGLTSTYRGGWVYSTSIVSGQNCHHLGEELVKFQWRARVGPNHPIVTTTIWTRPGFNTTTHTTATDSSVALASALRITRATGPFILKALNANVCVKVTPNQPGSQVKQGDYAEGDCRKLFFDRIGFVNGFPYGEWETSGGRNALASSNCSTVTLQAIHSTGTSWVTFIMGGGVPIKIINKRCDGNIGGSNCVEALAATGDIGASWFVINWRENPGFFTNMHIIQTSARPRIQAGC